MSLSKLEIEELRNVFARRKGDDHSPKSVQRRAAQIRALIDEVEMWRQSAGKESK